MHPFVVDKRRAGRRKAFSMEQLARSCCVYIAAVGEMDVQIKIGQVKM